MSKKISGQSIIKINTIKSIYDQDSISLINNKGEEFRLKVDELFKVISGLSFEVEKKKTHTYLKIKVE